MAKDSQYAVQAAVYAALRTDSALISLAGDGATPERACVYDSEPDESLWTGEYANDAASPYVMIGETTAVPWDTKTTDGMEQTLTLHTWSRDRSRAQVLQVMAAVLDAVDAASLTVAGNTAVLVRFEFADVFRDPDGLTWHGVQRFRVLTEATAS